jgi:hypothetical protein
MIAPTESTGFSASPARCTRSEGRGSRSTGADTENVPLNPMEGAASWPWYSDRTLLKSPPENRPDPKFAGLAFAESRPPRERDSRQHANKKRCTSQLQPALQASFCDPRPRRIRVRTSARYLPENSQAHRGVDTDCAAVARRVRRAEINRAGTLTMLRTLGGVHSLNVKVRPMEQLGHSLFVFVSVLGKPRRL